MGNSVENLIKETEADLYSYITELDTYMPHEDLLKLTTKIYQTRLFLDKLKVAKKGVGVSEEDYKKVKELADNWHGQNIKLFNQVQTLKNENYLMKLFIEDNVSEEKKKELFK